jgi:SAM-dependent methyltransferase
MARPIGDFIAAVHDRQLTRLAIRALGVIDLHSHSRLRPLFDYFDNMSPEKTLSILEVGCGDGINLFELHRRRGVHAVGYDLNPSAIEQAQRVNVTCFESALEFHCQEVTQIKDGGTYDYILCMDILEHINQPVELLGALDPLLKPGGCIVISVPTKRYPVVFGHRFNLDIGHVMDGYTLPLLDDIISGRYTRIYHAYSTGRLASLGCMLYYRLAMQVGQRQARLALHIILIALFKWVDPLNDSKSSCSLFAVYKKG